MNLRTELERTRERTDFDPLAAATAIWRVNQIRRDAIKSNILAGAAAENNFNADAIDSGRVFHISHIRKICIAYRLRFLDTRYFQDGLPDEAITKVRELEKLHGTTLGNFHIMAPKRAFRLLNYNDPLLFAPLDDDHFYLIHQWGNELSRWRKIAVWPFRHLGTFTAVCVCLSLLLTLAFPLDRLADKIPMAALIVFLFTFKSVFAVLMYGFFMGGRKFSAQAWNSRFHNS